jgi:hypothetical protein
MFIKAEGYIINVNQIKYIKKDEPKGEVVVHLDDEIITIHTAPNKVELVYGIITKQLYDSQLLTKTKIREEKQNG